LKVAVSEFCNEEDSAWIWPLTDPPDVDADVAAVVAVAAFGPELEHAASVAPRRTSPTSAEVRCAMRRREVDVDVMGDTPALEDAVFRHFASAV
jgi:hypothetical protein